MSANPPVTDAATDSKANVPAEAPAPAVRSFYLATTQALVNAIRNATESQQQSYTTMQDSTVQAVITLLGADTTPTGVDPATLWRHSAAAVASAAAPAARLTDSPDVQRLLDELSHETADVAYHVRSLMSAFAASLDALSIANARQQLRVLQNAAIAVCVKAMLDQPEKARDYEQALQIIRQLV